MNQTLSIYDSRDFPKEAHLPNGDQVIMEIGPSGRRLKREFYDYSEGAWETTYYAYAGIQGIADYDEDWNLEAYYIPGLGIDRIEIMRKNNTDYYFVRDHLGSVRLIVDSNGDIVEQYEYSTYGELTIKNGSDQTISSSAIGNRHTYTGREWDEDLELYYYRARWYDPKMRRFTQKDIIHFTNRYIYVLNNPMNLVDPFGLYGETIDDYGTYHPPMFPGDTGWWELSEWPTSGIDIKKLVENIARNKAKELIPPPGACLTKARARGKKMKDTVEEYGYEIEMRIWHARLIPGFHHFQAQYDMGDGWKTIDTFPWFFTWPMGWPEPYGKDVDFLAGNKLSYPLRLDQIQGNLRWIPPEFWMGS